jgi:nitrate/TMAO reductase-like tetraheme cytochrome c subunit
LKSKILEEKYKMSESKFKASKEHYEKVIKEKNDRIRELEVENEVLKKRQLGRISNNLHLHRQNST